MSGAIVRCALVSLLLALDAAGALAQTSDAQPSDGGGRDRGGFAVREVSVSTGYGAVQLPPITLGGYLPADIFHADLVTSASAAIDWRHTTRRTSYSLDLFGTYTDRARYSQLNAPGADVNVGVTRTVGNRWRMAMGVAGALVSSDQLATQSTQTRRLVDDAGSFEDLAGTVALARSPSPDLNHAALFVPITQSLDTGDLSGNTGVISSVTASATYAHSVRLSTHIDANYTTVRQWATNQRPDQHVLSLDSTAEYVGLGIRYDRSERSQFTADTAWSQTAGVATDEVVSATVGYGWTGRKWFMRTTVGGALRPFHQSDANRLPVIIYSGAIGYKFNAQTLLVQYTRAPHDELGQGGRNTITGFEGDMQSIAGSWLWSRPRSRWTARTDFSLIRRPGNFSYTYAWLATGGIGRRFGSNVRVMGELVFDRHGSRGFEGFHLTREEARLTFILMLPRRRLESASPGQ
jgi:hypothetical protein